ncbi:Protein of unknown function [Pyronema omphalodes CBS 100304]|uniref:Uncharacterized protein n=1 Tax=Pyronema omphalodes (strain CBS 100304) TaxID=1076935 RepID=U4LF09_PYROM|nr:Protein of unknown function [Pyronema omphalodes CBS 100304]
MATVTVTISPTEPPKPPNSSTSDLDYTWTPSPGSHCCYATHCTTREYHFKPVPGRIYARCKRCCSEFCDDCVRKGMTRHDCEGNNEKGYDDCSSDESGYEELGGSEDCKTQ